MAAMIQHVDPHIRVKNVARSAEWYARMLGLTVEMAMPDKKAPSFVRLGSDAGVALMISDGGDPMKAKPPTKTVAAAISTRKAQHVVDLYFRVDSDVKKLYASAKRKGAKISQELTEQPYGMLDFAMKDPDGYTVTVGQDVTPS
ncbi:MAG: VOC family protein [Chloroflexi bacterium]|nr:VOC family protein [Chloroflexota bacterium]MDA1145763.1 VOC family protein [Chloroflexota bacterium]